MININEVKELVYFLANKEGMGSISPSEFNIAVNSAVLGWTNQKYSNDKEYQPGNPVPRSGWQVNQRLSDDLKHLLVSKILFVVDGKMELPDGRTVYDVLGGIAPEYLHVSSISFYGYDIRTDTGKNYPVEVLMDNEFNTLDSSMVNTPSKRFPKVTFRDTYLDVLPRNITKLNFNYLRQPNECSWTYTIEDGEPVYDATNSIDLDAPHDAKNQIALLTLSELGINLRDVELINYSQTKESGL